MREMEARIMRQVRHSFFVSAALRDRAIHDYKLETGRASVSMNATEDQFLVPVPSERMEAMFRAHPKLKRPLAGVVGGINDRLDFELLRRVADLPEIGSLLLVGTMARPIEPACGNLLNHPRVLAVGPQPHSALPVWQQMLDLALIPYRRSSFNHYCSPMRLFDHLAAGRPIVATDACAQVEEFRGHVTVARTTEDFLADVRSVCSAEFSEAKSDELRSMASQNIWASRARNLAARMPVSDGQLADGIKVG